KVLQEHHRGRLGRRRLNDHYPIELQLRARERCPIEQFLALAPEMDRMDMQQSVVIRRIDTDPGDLIGKPGQPDTIDLPLVRQSYLPDDGGLFAERIARGFDKDLK